MKIGVTKLDISLPALMSILALVILVGISCVNEDLNVGFLGIAFGIIVGGVFGGTPASKIMNAFPLSLFMILVGVTFLFGMAQTNGTMEKLTAYSIRVCKVNTALIPIIIFLLSDFLTTIGPGNIAGCALMAPVAMAIAGRVKMPAFLMTLLVVGACNAAAFSPLHRPASSPTASSLKLLLISESLLINSMLLHGWYTSNPLLHKAS